MAETVAVCKLDDIAPGEARQVKAGGKEIALVRLPSGECYAIGGRCTHLRARLGEGQLGGTTLTCPWHGAQFDVTSGRLVRWVQRPLLVSVAAKLVPPFLRRNVPKYEVRIDEGQVFVQV